MGGEARPRARGRDSEGGQAPLARRARTLALRKCTEQCQGGVASQGGCVRVDRDSAQASARLAYVRLFMLGTVSRAIETSLTCG